MCRAEELSWCSSQYLRPIHGHNARHNAVRALADRYGLAYYDYNVRYPDGFDWETCTTDRGIILITVAGAAVTADFGERLTEDIKVKRQSLRRTRKRHGRRIILNSMKAGDFSGCGEYRGRSSGGIDRNFYIAFFPGC